MKNKLIIVFLLLLNNMSSIAQTPEDNLIIVTLQDTTNLYQRVRQAITFTDLVIRQDSKPDTLMTHSERIHNKSIFVIATVVIVGSKVKISGAFGLGQEDFWGYPAWPKSYKRATYFKGSEAFHILRRIAIKLDGKIEYARVD